MKKRVNLNRVSALIMSFFLVSGSITPAFSITAKAEAVEVLNSACTIADMVFSYCASGGVAVLNDTVINEVYQVLGSSFGTVQTFVDNGLLTYADGTYVDTGLSVNIDSAIQNINSIDIGSLFNQTAQQNASGVAMTGAASLGGIAASVASTGFLPIAAGVAIEGWAGFQLGTLIANALGLYGKNATAGVKINTPADVLSKIPNGHQCISSFNTSGSGDYLTGYITYSFPSGGFLYYGVFNPYNTYGNGYRIQVSNDRIIWEGGIGPSAKDAYNLVLSEGRVNLFTIYGIANKFNSESAWSTAKNGWINGSIEPNKVKSPDLIGPNGNLSGNYNADDNSYTIPDALPQIDPNTQSVNPSGLSLDDWLRFANDAKGNYTSGNPEINNDIFNDILDAIRVLSPTPTPDPTPSPGGETYPVPGPVPSTTPVPDPEYQPETKPQPQYTEKPTENETDITEGDPFTTPDLLDRFPFCIPRDIYRVFTKLDSGARAAPHIQWRFNPNNMIDYTFDIDFSEWESVATLLRTLELLGFIVALAVATRKLILS